MGKIKKSIAIFCFVLLSLFFVNLNGVNAADKQKVEPRINISEVVSFYDTLILYSDLPPVTMNYNYNYITIQYVNGYRSTTSQSNISSFVDMLANRQRYRTTYHYTTY